MRGVKRKRGTRKGASSTEKDEVQRVVKKMSPSWSEPTVVPGVSRIVRSTEWAPASTASSSTLADELTHHDSPADATLEPPVNDEPTPTQHSPSSEKAIPKQTRSAKVLADLMEGADIIEEALFQDHYDPIIGTPCDCGVMGAICECQCRDCNQFKPVCKLCFLAAHRNNRLHWAYVWDAKVGFFKKQDISTLGPEGFAWQMGHFGKDCPWPESDVEIMFTIVGINGVHSTKLQFCGCQHFSLVRKRRQLLQARLFPATGVSPKTAFTFEVLRTNSLFHLQSKCSAYDFHGALQRLTDNVFTHAVSDTYKAFLKVTRVYDHLTMKKRLGQFHGIDELLPFRPSGSLVVRCPSCPEPGMNTLPKTSETPHNLRHLEQNQITNDGCFKTGQYFKNTDPDDTSLSAGNAYMPPDSEYVSYLSTVDTTPEKSMCNYIKAVNQQAIRKFESMRITGTINTQCGHTLVLSCVDLQLGERFANSDFAIARALRMFDYDKLLEIVLSYDSNCSYHVNFRTRFEKEFPDIVHIWEIMRFLIPLMHVEGHQEICKITMASSYQESVGHNHGETAEHQHPELGRLGAQLKHMNHGHRHDKLNNFHGDWNHKKVISMGAALERDLDDAQHLFYEKRDHLLGLSNLHADKIDEWRKLDRTPIIDKKRVISVYCRTKSIKLPSVQAIVSSRTPVATGAIEEESDGSSSGDRRAAFGIACLFEEALHIEHSQRQIKAALKNEEKMETEAHLVQIERRRKKLAQRLESFSKLQEKLMPTVHQFLLDVAASETSATPKPLEEASLYLPSDFTSKQRLDLGLCSLAAEEKTFREAALCDAVRRIRDAAQLLSAFGHDKYKNSRGQKQNTRSKTPMVAQEAKRDQELLSYNLNRARYQKLSGETERFPELTVADTYRKSTEEHRRLGDSRRPDGAVWSFGKATLQTSNLNVSSSLASKATAMERSDLVTSGHYAGTVQSARVRAWQQPQSPSATSQSKKLKATAEMGLQRASIMDDDFIWNTHLLSGMDAKEVKEWEDESDRIQWFRADAEMSRWLEQLEMKHAEFERTIRYFWKMRDHWLTLSAKSEPARQAYAKKQSATFACLATEAQTRYDKHGRRKDEQGNERGCTIHDRPVGVTLAEAVMSFRARELAGLSI